jgi:mRNA-degrading endonuclease RelE of RelBE toxin-antitoxin system
MVETRNRKRMRRSAQMPGPMWELRIGHLRVYYEVNEEEDPKVIVTAIGVKVRNRVRIGGEEIEL